MPNAAVIGAALTDHSAHPYSLWVDGLDVIGVPATTIGTELTSIRVTERGPGGVSDIEFSVWDPTGTFTPVNGAVILFWWNTTDVPLFRGWVDTWSSTPDFGGQGRTVRIQGIGEEALLDWLIIANLGSNVPGGFPEQVAQWAMVAGVPNYQTGPFGVPTLSSQSNPISNYVRGPGDVTTLGCNVNNGQLAGQSLRQSIQDLFDASARVDQQPALIGATQARIQFTMDFYGGLRMWQDYPTIIPSDYTNLTINDAYAGPIVAENLQYAVDPSQIVHEVYVNGSAAANSGWFGDGTGLKGKQQYISDTTNITSPTLAQQAAQAVFQANSNQVRGSFELTDFTPVSTIHAGSFVSLTDAAVGLSAVSYRIMEIEKTFNGSGRQNWKVTFGSLAPNVVNYTRRLTYQVRA
jgi:hypothetical protein